MRRRGHVFQPDGKGSEYRLTERGVKWVEEEVLPRLGEG
jgi:predicted transcriptional regulator